MWNYYRDEPNSSTDNDNITHSILNSKSFDYKANFIGSVTNNNLTKNDVKIVIPLKHLSNFWRSLDILLINCEVELILTWSKNCALADITVRAAENNKDCSTNWIRVSNNRCKIICTSCYFIKGKSYKASRAIRDRIKKSYKMEQIQITNVYSE